MTEVIAYAAVVIALCALSAAVFAIYIALQKAENWHVGEALVTARAFKAEVLELRPKVQSSIERSLEARFDYHQITSDLNRALELGLQNQEDIKLLKNLLGALSKDPRVRATIVDTGSHKRVKPKAG